MTFSALKRETHHSNFKPSNNWHLLTRWQALSHQILLLHICNWIQQFFWVFIANTKCKTVVIDLLKTMNFNPSWLYHLPPLNPSWNEDNHDLWARYWYHDHGRWCWRSFLKKLSRFPSVVGDSMTLKERQSLDAFRTWYVYCPEWGYWHWLFSPSPKQHAEGLLFPMLFLCRCKGDGVLWKPSRMEPVIYYRYHLGNWLL